VSESRGPLPLEDVRVLDLTVARAGPTCVRQLADWGADVVRIEPPPAPGGGGDAATGASRHGSDFQNLHRNKRSLGLDLKSQSGRELLYRLVDGADIVVENMRPPVKYRLGVDYETLSARNPRLIYGSISGFGQDGPYAERGGVDQIAQGLGGLMSITGLPGQGPVRVGVPISDLCAGIYLAMGLLAALHERGRSGQGQWVRTSLLEAMVAMLDFQATRWTIDGEIPAQEGNNHPTAIPMGCFETADGYINVAGPSGRLYRNFLDVVGLTQLRDDERFATAALRSANRAELNALVAERLATRTSAEWIEALNAAGVPAGPVNDIAQTMTDPQVAHLGLVSEVEHRALGPQRVVRNAVQMSRTNHYMRRASPDAGEHSDEVLAELGLAPAEIAALREAGVVG